MRTGIFLFMLLSLTGWTALHAAEMPGLKTGDAAPDFKARTHEGRDVRLSDLTAKGPVVLIFYRGAWCPYCNLQLRSFQARYPAIKDLGASVLAVSVDLQEYGVKTVRENELTFDVVSDPAAEILASYGLLHQVPEELRGEYREKHDIDLAAHSGREDGVIAIPAVYVIDTSGNIVFAYANEDYKTRTQPEEIIEFLKTLQS